MLRARAIATKSSCGCCSSMGVWTPAGPKQPWLGDAVSGGSSSLVPVPVSAAPPQAAVMGSAAVIQGTGQVLGSTSSAENERRAAIAGAEVGRFVGGSRGNRAAAIGWVSVMVADTNALRSSSIRRPRGMMSGVLAPTITELLCGRVPLWPS